jgi:hypothetical protein
MKFFTTAFLVLISAVSSITTAQNSINSPYSRFGLGKLYAPGNVRAFGLGGAGTSIMDGSLLNFQNPASYVYLQQTTLQVAGRVNTSTITEGDASTDFRGGQVGEMGLGFKKEGSKWAFAMGLTPYSSTGYAINSPFRVNDSVGGQYRFSGDGGLNRFILGTARSFSFKVDSARQQVHRLSLGANFNWIFGQINQTRRVEFDDNDFYNTLINSRLSISDIQFDLGLHYTAPIHLIREDGKVVRGNYLLLGINYSIGNSMRSNLDQYGFTFVNLSGSEIRADSSFQAIDQKGTIAMPARISTGLGFLMLGKKGSSLLINSEWTRQSWSTYSTSFGSQLSAQQLSDFSQLCGGVEYTPRDVFKAKTIFGKMVYRAGYRNTTTYYQIAGGQVIESAFAAGLSIPFTAGKSRYSNFSKMHLGVEYGSATGEGENLVTEDFIHFQIGFSFVPFERWFERTKYD